MSAERPNPIVAGVLSRCPACGEGGLFSSYLTVARTCESCGRDLSAAASGDGPAVFVMLIVGAVVVPLALVLEVTGVAIWLNLIIALTLAVVLTAVLLPPFKATLIALQFHHKAAEARVED